jgi:transposase-like protein
MAWTEKGMMNQRFIFIAECLRKDAAMSQICLRCGIVRKTGYKWLGRYRNDATRTRRSLAGSAIRSRA